MNHLDRPAQTKRLDELCDFINGGAWNESEYTEFGIPVLKVSNFNENSFSLDSISYLSLDAKVKYNKHELKHDDLAHLSIFATCFSYKTNT